MDFQSSQIKEMTKEVFVRPGFYNPQYSTVDIVGSINVRCKVRTDNCKRNTMLTLLFANFQIEMVFQLVISLLQLSNMTSIV